MSSAYVIMDVTNPEKPPRVLAEIRMPNQGFTTCYPTVMPMGIRGSAAPLSENQWYLVFGSGPANVMGEADPMIINTDTSSQNGQLYVLDLLSLATHGSLVSLNSAGQFTAGTHTFATTEPGSFISDPIAADFDIGAENSGEFRTDVVYYGTVSGDQTFGQGTVRRLITENTLAVAGTVTWSGNSTLADVGKPVTAAPSVAMDEQKRVWVYFGAGRFFNRDDIPQAHDMSFFGIKEPVSSGILTWAEVNDADLYNSTQISLTNGTCVGDAYTRDCVQVYKSGTLMSGGWTQLETAVAASPGWRQEFQAAYERVLGQAAVLGGNGPFHELPAFPGILCEFEGSSRLWALFYKTGTAYFRPILRNASDPFATYVDLGRGLAMTRTFTSAKKKGLPPSSRPVPAPSKQSKSPTPSPSNQEASSG
jgi:type IV pilus assembly protein PilY1